MPEGEIAQGQQGIEHFGCGVAIRATPDRNLFGGAAAIPQGFEQAGLGWRHDDPSEQEGQVGVGQRLRSQVELQCEPLNYRVGASTEPHETSNLAFRVTGAIQPMATTQSIQRPVPETSARYIHGEHRSREYRPRPSYPLARHSGSPALPGPKPVLAPS